MLSPLFIRYHQDHNLEVNKVRSKLTEPVPVPGQRSLVAPADGRAHEVGSRHLNLLAIDHWWWPGKGRSGIIHRQKEGKAIIWTSGGDTCIVRNQNLCNVIFQKSEEDVSLLLTGLGPLVGPETNFHLAISSTTCGDLYFHFHYLCLLPSSIIRINFLPWAEEGRKIDYLLVAGAAVRGADLDAVHALGSAHAAAELKSQFEEMIVKFNFKHIHTLGRVRRYPRKNS